MTYTIHLVLLECLEGQEFDGDEPYLKLNDKVVWSWDDAGLKMHDQLNAKDWTNAYDFRTCKYRTLQGWEVSRSYKPEDFTFPGLSGETSIQLWEADEHEILRGDDDFLGELVVHEENVRMGPQLVEFSQNGAFYVLTYRVTEDA